jgi:hypothetical protein
MAAHIRAHRWLSIRRLMCSVSFIPNSRGFCVGMNRDESLQRPVAHPPEVVTRGGYVALYPKEPTGGSWIGVNDAGLTIALINWYAIPRLPDVGRVSRGIVVPALLASPGAEEVRDAIVTLPKHGMAPFRLLVFAPRERAVTEFRWDQHMLEELPRGWQPRHWFSSGCDEPRARQERAEVAREAWHDPRAGSLPWLRRLHGSHEPARGPFCFCMHREGAATVSYTEIIVTGRAATMRYHDGPLCSVPRPRTTHKISLQTACKESVLNPTNQQIGYSHERHQFPFQPSRCSLLPRGISSRREICTVTR